MSKSSSDDIELKQRQAAARARQRALENDRTNPPKPGWNNVTIGFREERSQE